jgi:spermidine synthase
MNTTTTPRASAATGEEMWFNEKEDLTLWPGQRFSLRVKETLFKEKSEYQEVIVLESVSYGRVLVLDGIIQVTERDEFAYQECISHIPLYIHPCPRSVLIIGAGDGGVTREIVKHPGIEIIVHVEIDKLVPQVSKMFFQDTLATGFEDPRVRLLFEDGDVFLRTTKERFDVVIVDSGDPVGPNRSLFEEDFYSRIRNVLRPGGVMCAQGENMWLHLDLIGNLLTRCSRIYPVVSYAYACIPSYPSGQIGFVVCSLDPNTDLSTPSRSTDSELLQGAPLRYYSEQMHKAAFTLPVFAEQVLPKVKRDLTKNYNQSPVWGITLLAAAVLVFGAALLAKHVK